MKSKIHRIFIRPIEGFFETEVASGVILAACAVSAMMIANSSWSSYYFNVLHFSVLGLSIQHWINDGLMAVFFFVIGMEIKKELIAGELSSPSKAALPVAAALGGMILPALIYFYFNPNNPNLRGWGIPMATDIAFALGILGLFGKRVPLSLKVFLLALAIVDDLGAVLVIAFFYTEGIRGQGLALATLVFSLMVLFRSIGVRSYFVYFVLGVIGWFGFLYSGVHATVAGVLMGLLTPFSFPTGKGRATTYSPLEDLVHFLHPWVSFGIMPVFALANAGIVLQNIDFRELIGNPIHQGVVLGLVLGKPVGIILFSALAVVFKLGSLPSRLRWAHVCGVGFLGGIGFTMALFISNLALSAEQEVYSKTGIVFGSLIAALLGCLILSAVFFKDQKS